MGTPHRILLTRLVTGLILFFLILRWLGHALLSQLLSPPLFEPEMDITYWLYKLSGIPTLIVQNKTGALLFDISLFLTGCLTLLFPLSRKWLIPFSILLFGYALSYDGYAMHHFAQVSGFMIVLLPFWAAGNYAFSLAWEGLRYYTCLVYTMAFIWKACINNSFYYIPQGTGSFKANLVDYIWLNPDNLLTHFYQWMIRHEGLLNAGEKGIVILEGIMAVGFFTRKYDRFLIWIPVFIHVVTYFFADVFFIELLMINLSFLSVKQLEYINALTPFGRELKIAGMGRGYR